MTNKSDDIVRVSNFIRLKEEEKKIVGTFGKIVEKELESNFIDSKRLIRKILDEKYKIKPFFFSTLSPTLWILKFNRIVIIIIEIFRTNLNLSTKFGITL